MYNAMYMVIPPNVTGKCPSDTFSHVTGIDDLGTGIYFYVDSCNVPWDGLVDVGVKDEGTYTYVNTKER